jgi:hypothetical protein
MLEIEETWDGARLMGHCKSDHRDFKGNMVQCKSEGKDFRRDYAKEKLRENTGQSESKERDFKE